MKNSNIILYSAGAYGNFINWCCDYFSGRLNSDVVPLNDLGSCHNYTDTILLMWPPEFKKYTENADAAFHQFVQVHEHSFDVTDTNLILEKRIVELLVKNLTYLQENYKKSIYVYATNTSKIWLLNNAIYKIRMADWFGTRDEQFIREHFTNKGVTTATIDELICYGDDRLKKQINNQSILQKNLQQWGHNSIDEFKVWELRELLSKYYYDRLLNSITPPSDIADLKLKFPNIYFIELDQLRDNFEQTIYNILQYFEISPIEHWTKINNIHQTWAAKQIHMNKDQQIVRIVDAVSTGQALDWSDWKLTLIDEFIIQRKLLDDNIEIKCWGLDIFPTNTKDFLPLLERI